MPAGLAARSSTASTSGTAPVTLVHEDTAALRRMAVFDIVVNNADRKGGHVLEMAGGHRYGVDHGVAFHHEHKLRTVLWGWRGRAARPTRRSPGVLRVRDGARRLARRGRWPTTSPTSRSTRVDRALRPAAATGGCFPAPRGRVARDPVAALLIRARSAPD